MSSQAIQTLQSLHLGQADGMLLYAMLGLVNSDFDEVQVSRRQVSRRLLWIEYQTYQTIQHWQITYQIKKQKRIKTSGQQKIVSRLLSLSLNKKPKAIENGEVQEKKAASSSSSSVESRKKEVYKVLRKRFSHKATIGIMANIHVQSGGTYDPKMKQRGSYDKVKKRFKDGPGYGIFQFDFHKKYYFQYLKDNQFQDTIESQVSYMVSTIYGKQRQIMGAGNANKVKDFLNDPSLSAEEITVLFCNLWEKPNPEKAHLQRRKAACKSLESEFKQ